MTDDMQPELFSQVTDLGLVRFLLAELHDDLDGKVARFHQLSDLSMSLGSSGTMLPGGESAYAAWMEARSSFIHGNYIATVQLCQSLAEHMLAAHLTTGLGGEELPPRISFQKTLDLCIARGVIAPDDSNELRSLMALRNPLSHYRGINDPSNLSRRVMDTQQTAESNLLNDATFAICVAIRLLGLAAFRLGD